MIHTLIGKDLFRKGITKYFELYDGQAVTTEDFLYAMEQVSGRDFTQFKRWYSQAGTPEIDVSTSYDADKKTYALTIKQTCEPTADKSPKEPFHFPIALGLLGKDGQDMPLKLKGVPLARPLIEVTQPEETFIFENVAEQPVLSINRDFSAPIKVNIHYSPQEYTFLMAHDSDPFNRWEAGQKLATNLMLGMVEDLAHGRDFELDPGFIKAFGAILEDTSLDNGLKALALILPSESTLSQFQETIDFDGIHLVREFMRYKLAETYQKQFKAKYVAMNTSEPYAFNAEAVGKRSLKEICLGYLSCLETHETTALCEQQFNSAKNMTDQFAALLFLANIACSEKDKAIRDFYTQWKHDTLVMNKWLAVQAHSKLDGTFETVNALLKDPVFDIKTPNLVRALLISFTQNLIHFHRNDGVGYEFIADRIIELDKVNPQVAAALAKSYAKYSQLDPMRKKAMKKALERIVAEPKLSSNVFEIVSKSLVW
jgi:aminopeptidase N